jgi:hydrogenase maturation protease
MTPKKYSGDMNRKPRVLVVCIGNEIVSDDGAGCEVHRRLEGADLPSDVRLVLIGVGGIALLEELGGEESMIIVDAVRLGAPAGTLHVFEWSDLPDTGVVPASAHGVGARQALAIGARVCPEQMPKRVVVVGIEGARFDEIGTELTPAVAAGVTRATERVLEMIAEMR